MKNLFVVLENNKIKVKEGLFYENERFCVIVNNHVYDLNYKKINLKKIIDYYQNNIELANVISNNFTIIIIDKWNKKLTCIQDVNGDTIPIYYFKNKNKVLCSNKLVHIIDNMEQTAEMNSNSITYFIKKGYIPNKETLLKNVYKVVPKYNLVISLEKNYKEKQLKKRIKHLKIDNLNTERYIQEFKKVLNTSEKNKKVYTTMSNGYDSNFIFNFLNKNKPIEAFSVGGSCGTDETKMVQENIKKYQNTYLNVSYVNEKTLDHYPELVYHLEGAMYERGIFLQYELLNSIHTKKNEDVVLFCGEGSDQIFSWAYHSNFLYFCKNVLYFLRMLKYPTWKEELRNINVKGGFLYRSSIYQTLSYIIMKKNGILMNEANISYVYPYLYKNIVDIGYYNRHQNFKYKNSHVKACNQEIEPTILNNIQKIGGTTDQIALFQNCSYMDKIESFVQKSKYNILKIKRDLHYNSYLDYLLKVLYLEIFEYIFVDNDYKSQDIKNINLMQVLQERYN